MSTHLNLSYTMSTLATIVSTSQYMVFISSMFWMELYALPFKTHLVLKTGQMYSKLGIQLTAIPTCILYMILIFVSIKAWLNLMAEQTAFEETTFESNKKIPSFTSCQKLIGNNKSMESLEDVAKIESKPNMEGRRMIMILTPTK